MSLTIVLTPEEELRLQRIARARGQSPEDYIIEQIRPQLAEYVFDPGDSDLPELWRGLVGVLHSGHGSLSQETGKRFTEDLAEKKREGHL